MTPARTFGPAATWRSVLLRYGRVWMGAPLVAAIAAAVVSLVRGPEFVAQAAAPHVDPLIEGSPDQPTAHDVPTDAQFSDGVDWDDVDERLAAAVRALPDEFRAPFLLFAVEDLKYREIAAVLDVPIGTVMSRLARARRQLMERLGYGAGGNRGRNVGQGNGNGNRNGVGHQRVQG